MTATDTPAPSTPGPAATDTPTGRVYRLDPKETAAFVGYIHALCKQPGPRAALRRGVARPPERFPPQAHRYLVPRVPERASDDLTAILYTCAALIAAHPDLRATTRRPVGESLADIANKGVVKNLDPRVHATVKAPLTGVLYRHLPGLVGLVDAADTHLHWESVIDDLSQWRIARPDVTTRWMRAYYRSIKTETATAEETD